MKFFLLLLLLPLCLLSNKNTVMLQIHPKNFQLEEEPFEIIKGAAETAITKSGFMLIDPEAQKQALKEQSEQRKKGCYDTSCLVATGQMLAASSIIKIEVIKISDNRYKFVLKVINVEEGTTVLTDTFWYDSTLDDIEKLDKTVLKSMKDKLFKVAINKDSSDDGNNSDKKDFKKGDSSSVEVITKDSKKDSEGKYLVEIKSDPSGAEIFDDVTGKFWGTTPFSAKMKPGKYSVNVEAGKNYKPQKRTFIVKGNSSVFLNLQSRLTDITITSDPDGAFVYIDGKRLGRTPFKGKHLEGNYNIKLVKNGRKTIEEKIYITKNLKLNYRMKLNISVLTLRSKPSRADVYLDGQSYGKTPIKLKLTNSRSYKVELRKTDYKTEKTTIMIADDTSRTIYMRRDKFFITLKTNVPAKVYYKGNIIGKTPLKTDFKEGTHKILLKSEQFPDTYHNINVREDKEYYIELKNKATVKIKANVSSSVYLDGVYKGKTPLWLYDIPFGKHKIKLSAYNYTTLEKTLNVKGNDEFTYTLVSTYTTRKNRKYTDTDEGIMFGVNVFGIGREYFIDENGKEDKQLVTMFVPTVKFGFFKSWEEKKGYRTKSMKRIHFAGEFIFGLPLMGYALESMYSISFDDYAIVFGPKFYHYFDFGIFRDDYSDSYDSDISSRKSIGLALQFHYNVDDDFGFNFFELFIGTDKTVFVLFNFYVQGYDD